MSRALPPDRGAADPGSHSEAPAELAMAKKPTIMVSSVVYGVEELLEQVFATLEGYGYTVWMSYKGSIPVDPTKNNTQNCLAAVDSCDAFLGLIFGRYGATLGRGRSITHREMLRAVSKNKPRWFLVHRNVTVARVLLHQFRFEPDGTTKPFSFQPTPVLEDQRVLEMYEAVTHANHPKVQSVGSWAQEFLSNQDALRFIRTQFEDPRRVHALLTKARSVGDRSS